MTSSLFTDVNRDTCIFSTQCSCPGTITRVMRRVPGSQNLVFFPVILISQQIQKLKILTQLHIYVTATLLYPLTRLSSVFTHMSSSYANCFEQKKCLRKKRIGLVHQHGRCFIVFEHQHGCHDVMCIRSINEGPDRQNSIVL